VNTPSIDLSDRCDMLSGSRLGRNPPGTVALLATDGGAAPPTSFDSARFLMSDFLLYELRARRDAVEADYTALVDAAQARGRWTAADEASAVAFKADRRDLDARIGQAEDYERRERNMPSDERRKINAITGTNVTEACHGAGNIERDLRSFFAGELRSVPVSVAGIKPHLRQDGRWEIRALGTTSTGIGGALVPSSLGRQIVEAVTEYAAIRQCGVTILQTSGGENLTIPQLVSHGTASIVAEGGTILANDPSFGTTVLSAYKYAQLLQLPRELIQDQVVDLLSWVARDMGRALGEASGADMILGPGTAGPLGVMVACGTGVVGGTAQAGIPTADELIDLFYSVPSAARARGVWLMNDATLAKIRKIKDEVDRYLVVDLGGLQNGSPATIMGRPVVTDPNVASCGTSANSICWGDFSAFWVRDVAEVELLSSQDFAFNQDLITWRAVARMDSRLLDASALKVYHGGSA
jgi:HK97 family phage major capsid protein